MTVSRKLVVNSKRQIAELIHGDVVIKKYVISTASKGLGCEEGSYCTPAGKLRVAQKIGDELPIGAVIKGRVPTGEIYSICTHKPDEDFVLTRLLWLEGTEPHNTNTRERFIYLHGTNQEHLLGRPASHGCIRFCNLDIIEVYNALDEGDIVEIV